MGDCLKECGAVHYFGPYILSKIQMASWCRKMPFGIDCIKYIRLEEWAISVLEQTAKQRNTARVSQIAWLFFFLQENFGIERNCCLWKNLWNHFFFYLEVVLCVPFLEFFFFVCFLWTFNPNFSWRKADILCCDFHLKAWTLSNCSPHLVIKSAVSAGGYKCLMMLVCISPLLCHRNRCDTL